MLCFLYPVMILWMGQRNPASLHHQKDGFSTQQKQWDLYWLVVSTNPSEKYVFVSWDDEIPNIWKKTMFQTTNGIFSTVFNW